MGKKITTVDLRSRAKRRQTRKVPLKHLVVLPNTLRRYENAVASFFTFLRNEKLSFPTETWELDARLEHFVEYLWEQGDSRSLASNCLAGLQHFVPFVKRRIPGAWRLVKAWQKNELPARATPLWEELVQAISAWFLGRNEPRSAIGFLLGFHCLLRTGELAQVKSSDLHLARVGVLNLGLTKSGLRTGAAESVTIHDPILLKWLAAWQLHALPGDKLFPGGDAEIRKQFAKAMEAFQLQDQGFKPYSLRRGGATHHFRVYGSLSRTVVRGRWATQNTARIYINDGLATLAEFRQAQATTRKITRYLAEYHRWAAISGR